MYKQQFLAQSDHLILPLIAFVLFFAVFLIVLFRTLRGWWKRERMDDVAFLPLDDAGEREGKSS